MGVSVSLLRDGKKGTIFRCETCSKVRSPGFPTRTVLRHNTQVYRHPSCLAKHRWEHSPHWRETSKFLLSKHQQVQLLEVHYFALLSLPCPHTHSTFSQAAAILSHLAPSARGGASLPEDRALWPAYLSGGKLYPTTNTMTTPTNATLVAEESPLILSSSLPNSSRLRSPHSTPRVHEYAVTSTSNIKHVRPGVFSANRNYLGNSIDRRTSSPIDLRSVKKVGGISSRNKSESAWNPYSPSVASRSSHSPPAEDNSDFEMDEGSTLNHANH